MSQNVTYKTKFKSLNEIRNVLRKLVADGKVFGPNAKLSVKGDPDFDTSLYEQYGDKIIMRVSTGGSRGSGGRGQDNGIFSHDGFYDKGFGVVVDPQTKEITLVFDIYDVREDDPEIVRAKQMAEKHIDSQVSLEKAKKVLGNAKGVSIVEKDDGSWTIRGKIPAAILKQLKETKAN